MRYWSRTHVIARYCRLDFTSFVYTRAIGSASSTGTAIATAAEEHGNIVRPVGQSYYEIRNILLEKEYRRK